ncbi:MAG: UDP-N-acetylmuramoyl-L-alanyl-D-glutamate--2,6-diaminopimelate ligase, partial [Clostridia bacterium]|nr:UDP-N-acetylmuramoyl-L-alanyl-D-glutamate--2,6-diaminopimelate ligase [Clostridia bacterium]
MKFSELYDIKNYKISDFEVTGILCDSRKVVKDSVFVCIQGAAMDGHDFAKDAYEKGASVIISQKELEFDNVIVVEDTKAVYATLCAAYFNNPSKSLKIIGVTGTSGKTSVTYMTKNLLESQGKKVGLIGTIQ